MSPSEARERVAVIYDSRADQITKQDLLSLVDDEVPEGRHLEYKEELPGSSDKEKHELLADVSAFANASGGMILYGIRETGTGLPESVEGVAVGDVDQQVLRLVQLIRDSLEPTLVAFEVVAVHGFRLGPVIVVKIPTSLNSPHMVVHKRRANRQFYIRADRGKHPLDVTELRAAFERSAGVSERARDFRRTRLGLILADELPVRLPRFARTVLHVIPLASLSTEVSLTLPDESELLRLFRPIHASGWNGHFNFDGFVTHYDSAGSHSWSYTQLLREGTLEAVEASMLEREIEGERKAGIPTGVFEERIASSVDGFLSALASLGFVAPFYVSLSLLGVKNFYLRVPTHWHSEAQPIHRENLLFPEVRVDSIEVPATTWMKPTFDSLWQAGGWSRSFNYDEDGNWAPYR